MTLDPNHSEMTSFRADETSPVDTYRLLTSGVCPRPVALVSTISADGTPNLAPFSFFNAFGANPPIVGFSPTRSLRDGSQKDTYQNLIATEECVIQSVPFDIVEQVNLSAAEFPSEVDEWEKCGLTPVPSQRVAPMRAAESPFQMECKLWQAVPLGDQPGSGNLLLCEVLVFHVASELLESGVPDASAMDHVGRLGGSLYSRSSGSAAFSVPRARYGRIVGFDQLPDNVRQSRFLTGNELARLAAHESVPSESDLEAFAAAHPARTGSEATCTRLVERGELERAFAVARFLLRAEPPRAEHLLERLVHHALAAGETDFAWHALMWLESNRSR